MIASRGAGCKATGGRRRAALAGGASMALAASVLAGPMAVPAAADPPLTVEEAKIQVERLETDAEVIDQQALHVKVKLAAGAKALALKQQDVRTQTTKTTRLRRQVAQVALAQFQQRTLDTTAKLFLTDDTNGFLNRIATVEKVTENQNRVLQDFTVKQTQLADLERSAKVDVAALRASDQELSRLRAASAAKVSQSRSVLARLTREERERIAAEERAAQLVIQQEAAAAEARRSSSESADPESAESDASGSGSSPGASGKHRSRSDTRPDSADRATGKGAIALAYAERQLGKPYVWAAEGPKAFDCSGLASAAWREAGLSIPRTSLVYVGDDVIIHAPRPGRTVSYARLSDRPFAGARRPG